MISVYIIHEGFQLKSCFANNRPKKGLIFYIWSYENILDTLLVLLSSLYLATIAYNELVLVKINSNLLLINTEFISFFQTYNLEKNLQLQCNVLIVIAFLKALNLLKFNPKTYLITDTLSTGFFEFTLLIVFVLCNYAIYGIVGCTFFDIDRQFETIDVSVITSVVSIVRHIDFDLLIKEKFNFLFAWQIFVWFYAQKILISFVISVIIATFNQVRQNHETTETEKTFSRIVQNALEYFHFRSGVNKRI
jgi:hypothetical protein